MPQADRRRHGVAASAGRDHDGRGEHGGRHERGDRPDESSPPSSRVRGRRRMRGGAPGRGVRFMILRRGWCTLRARPPATGSVLGGAASQRSCREERKRHSRNRWPRYRSPNRFANFRDGNARRGTATIRSRPLIGEFPCERTMSFRSSIGLDNVVSLRIGSCVGGSTTPRSRGSDPRTARAIHQRTEAKHVNTSARAPRPNRRSADDGRHRAAPPHAAPAPGVPRPTTTPDAPADAGRFGPT